ncbi:hypothetical protein [Cytobacillus purgationiresistens]|uniref:ABM domain-containing protein n=1 Tax=Cytobacillus purgationiresistens TaxID=863449 RepID=A0ABU0AN59_9BACI|nr:hypothetical protein [Cytobacillus purgationiresistens]MDQ0272475.1 hypothetical protein [Cytobacillus purgationiresistens]
MAIYVYQTFEIKQDQFKEALENLHKMADFRHEHFNHKVELLTPISGQDHTYTLLTTYEGLAEMELQNKKMFDDEEYQKMISSFFLEQIVQGSMHTQLFRAMASSSNGYVKKDRS